MKLLVYAIGVFVIVATAVAFVVYARDINQTNIEFLTRYGWCVGDEAIEHESVILPKTPDAVYQNYNKIQQEAGLDLSAYYGKRVERYTYIVKNYPADVGDEVRANVICYNRKPIAGDIMTVSADGFMHSLIYHDYSK